MQKDRDQHAALRAQERIGEDQRLGHEVGQEQPQRLALAPEPAVQTSGRCHNHQ